MHNILIINNHDSFTYNLVEVLRQTKLCIVKVVLFEELLEQDIVWSDGVILSPGPGLPAERKGYSALIMNIAAIKPLLGVCLGHQAIAEAYGGKIVPIGKIIHGESSPATILSNDCLYSNMDNEFMVGRYHSWVIDKEELPQNFVITAETDDGLIMSMKHEKLNIRGVQYHPESILTPTGKKILSNWLSYCI